MYARKLSKLQQATIRRDCTREEFMKSVIGLMVFVASWVAVNAIVLKVLKRSLTFAEGIVCSIILMLVISAIMGRL